MLSAFGGHDSWAYNTEGGGLVIKVFFTELESKGNLVVEWDANAHHFQWGSQDTNTWDESIFDFIFKHNLKICNRAY